MFKNLFPVAALTLGLAIARLRAGDWDHKTAITISEPMNVQDTALQAGQYVMKLLDDNAERNVGRAASDCDRDRNASLPVSADGRYRTSERPYRPMAERIWGAQAFAARWPGDVKAVCDRPGPATASDPLLVHLSPIDRGIAQATFDAIAQAIAAYEGSDKVNPFSSKFDLVMADKAKVTPEEQVGYAHFRSNASHCNECHRDGGPGEEPLFTDFTASNLGLPANKAIPYYEERTAYSFGFTANKAGPGFGDMGVGGFLRGPLNPDNQWSSQAKSSAGKYKTPTLRNVDKRPQPDFVKAYMHNGYLKSLEEVVHFYNTRDTLPTCKAGDPGEKVSCWPAPEHPETMNRRQLGKLGLSAKQETAIVAFLKTLTDGYAGGK